MVLIATLEQVDLSLKVYGGEAQGNVVRSDLFMRNALTLHAMLGTRWHRQDDSGVLELVVLPVSGLCDTHHHLS
jgi:hypothetical protein